MILAPATKGPGAARPPRAPLARRPARPGATGTSPPSTAAASTLAAPASTSSPPPETPRRPAASSSPSRFVRRETAFGIFCLNGSSLFPEHPLLQQRGGVREEGLHQDRLERGRLRREGHAVKVDAGAGLRQEAERFEKVGWLSYFALNSQFLTQQQRENNIQISFALWRSILKHVIV